MAKKTAGWPGTGGSGPAPGVIGITEHTSVAALCNFYPRLGGVEFVYVPDAKVFVTGQYLHCPFSGSQHERLAYSTGALHSYALAGTFRRGLFGEFLTDEHSGHFGKKWSDFYRRSFPLWLTAMTGIVVRHQFWAGP